MRKPLLILMLLAPRAEAGSFGSDGVGTSSADFLKLGADSRGMALGEAMSAVADDSSAIYWNPAGLARIRTQEAGFTHAVMYQSVFYDFMSYARPLGSVIEPERRELRPSGLGTVGASLLYLNFGRLDEVDNTGASTGGSFTPQDFAAQVAWGATILNSLDLGVGFKYINARILTSAQTAAMDAGARVRTYLFEWPYDLAVSAQNIGPGLRYHFKSDPLPLAFRAGQSLRLLPGWILASDYVFPRDNAPYPTFGTEYRMSLPFEVSLAARLGWSARTNGSDLDGTSRISFGAGLGYKRFSVDYAWAPFGVLGSTQRFTLSGKF